MTGSQCSTSGCTNNARGLCQECRVEEKWGNAEQWWDDENDRPRIDVGGETDEQS